MPFEPIHVFYAGAHLLKPGMLPKLTALAVAALDNLAAPGSMVTGKVRERLQRQTIDDLRIDFEDGLGARTPGEEDEFARHAGRLAATPGTLPANWGIRLKSLQPATRARAIRTLEIFCEAAGVAPPVIAIPKVSTPEELAILGEWMEREHSAGRMELLVETAAAVRGLPALIEACQGRCAALHFGAYDFLSELGVPAPDQRLMHPFCDQARFAMRMAAGGKEIRVLDGVTNLLPLGGQAREGWLLHMANVRNSLSQGFGASWDLHPAQVAARLVALFTYFDEHQTALAERLEKFEAEKEKATRHGAAFDDAATAGGLVRFFELARHWRLAE
jgi:citrate lyase beta subunit